VETHCLPTSDVERDQDASRKPFLKCYTGITYSIECPAQGAIVPVASPNAISAVFSDSDLTTPGLIADRAHHTNMESLDVHVPLEVCESVIESATSVFLSQ
jgi:hypothetical protein